MIIRTWVSGLTMLQENLCEDWHSGQGLLIRRPLTVWKLFVIRLWPIDQTGKQKLREMAESIQETTRAWSERAGEDTRMLQSLFYARECGQEGSKSLADADAQRSATIAALFESAERG
jgi:hypothetical protein